MLARFKEICERVLKYRDSKDRMVAQTVISLLPRLAAFCPVSILFRCDVSPSIMIFEEAKCDFL